MKKLAMTLLCVFCLTVAGAPAAMAQDVKQEKCPVMGYKPSAKLYTDYKGKRIYFCCATCPETFKKDPEKYMKKIESEHITLEDAPTN
ncbi:YHS domain-containing protein [Desulfovibrio inopinatus]|uniref:YHS domain-containing protein n=1 Tax=Desulfovibrio inopinatus TaxID=102109 RepID=UPI0003FEE8BE|nr:YHS domain-containing protein [Desulfovibrio inopinatus]